MNMLTKHKFSFGILVLYTMLAIGAPAFAAEGECTTYNGASADNAKDPDRPFPYSLRDLVNNFNRKVNRDCVSKITLTSNYDLYKPLEFGSPEGGDSALLFDGQGYTINVKGEFPGNCAIVVNSAAKNIVFKNVTLSGRGSSEKSKSGEEISGICMKSTEGTLSNVKVRSFSGVGVSMEELNITIKDGSVISDTGLAGINATKMNVAKANRSYVSVDTVLKDTNGSDDVSANSASAIVVANDDTAYRIEEYSAPNNVLTIIGTVSPHSALAGASAGSKLLVYRAAATGETLQDTLIGYVTVAAAGRPQSDSLEVPASGPLSKGFTNGMLEGSFITTTDDTRADINAKHALFHLKMNITDEDEQVYLRFVPIDTADDAKAMVATTTPPLPTGGITQGREYRFQKSTGAQYCTVDQLTQVASCQSASADDSSEGGETSFSGEGSAAATPSADAPAAVTDWKKAMAQVDTDLTVLQTGCQNNWLKNSGTLFDIEGPSKDDNDGDGVPNIFEDPKGSCQGPRYNPDQDGDGLSDGMEDGNSNGFVDCEIKNGAKIGKLYPVFLGQLPDGTTCRIAVKPDNTIDDTTSDTGCKFRVSTVGGGELRIPDPDSLGQRDSFGVLWNGVPKFQKDGKDNGWDLKTLNCLETDPRKNNTDEDSLSDGEELQRRYVDRTQSGYLYQGGKIVGGELRPLHDVSGNRVECGSWMLTGQKLAVKWSLVRHPATSKITTVVCKSDGVNEQDYALSNVQDLCATKGTVTTCNQNNFGYSDPRVKDTDRDGKNDEEACPTNADATCKKQCFYGWRSDLIQQLAKIKFGTANAKSLYDAKYAEIEQHMKGYTLTDATWLLDNGVRSDSDNDNIPDLVESGLPASNGFYAESSDCSDSVIGTNPFVTWTDRVKLLKADGTVDADKLPIASHDSVALLDDDSDPCPGLVDKTKCTQEYRADQKKVIGQPQSEIAFLSKGAAIIGCFMDRDSDTLPDCVEDANGNGKLDSCGSAQQSCETAVLLDDTNDNGNSDADDIASGTNPVLPGTDTDGDGLSDAQEKGLPSDETREGTANIYEPSLSAKRSCDAVFPNSPTGNASKYDTDPNKADTDEDGINDGDEIKHRTNPNNPDSDNDGLCDGGKDVELKDANGAVLVSCIAGEDINGDGVTPKAKQPDTWDVGLSKDGLEESDPCDANTDAFDASGNKTEDLWSDLEDSCKTNPAVFCAVPGRYGTDSDSDGLDDKSEAKIGTNKDLADTDGDGLEDGCVADANGKDRGELCNMIASNNISRSFNKFRDCGSNTTGYAACDTNPVVADSDGDALPDGMERDLATNPRVEDTDGDCIPDGREAVSLKLNADGSTTQGLPDGMYKECVNQVNPNTGVFGKVCTELDPNNPDTDGDGLCDGFCGNMGEDLDQSCDGIPGRVATGANALAGNPAAFSRLSEPSPLNWDTDTDGVGDYQEMTEGGFFNNLNFSLATGGAQQGCSLIANDAQRTAGNANGLALVAGVVGLALMVLRRRAA